MHRGYFDRSPPSGIADGICGPGKYGTAFGYSSGKGVDEAIVDVVIVRELTHVRQGRLLHSTG